MTYQTTLYDVPLATAAPVQVSSVVTQQQPVNGDQKFTDASMGFATASYQQQQPSMKNSDKASMKNSCKAIASLVCSIICLVLPIIGVIFGPIAICLARQASKEIKEKPDQLKGKGMAKAGLIIGIIGFILHIIGLVIWALMLIAVWQITSQIDSLSDDSWTQ